jgi:hypothetical protein
VKNVVQNNTGVNLAPEGTQVFAILPTTLDDIVDSDQ